MRAECECRLGRSLALPRTPSPILRITQRHLDPCQVMSERSQLSRAQRSNDTDFSSEPDWSILYYRTITAGQLLVTLLIRVIRIYVFVHNLRPFDIQGHVSVSPYKRLKGLAGRLNDR